MTHYLVVISKGINERTIHTTFNWLLKDGDTPLKVAKRWRAIMYQDNGISRFNLFIYKIQRSYYVVRKISERELGDPIYGNRERKDKYRRYLTACHQRFKKMKRKKKVYLRNGV